MLGQGRGKYSHVMNALLSSFFNSNWRLKKTAYSEGHLYIPSALRYQGSINRYFWSKLLNSVIASIQLTGHFYVLYHSIIWDRFNRKFVWTVIVTTYFYGICDFFIFGILTGTNVDGYWVQVSLANRGGYVRDKSQTVNTKTSILSLNYANFR